MSLKFEVSRWMFLTDSNNRNHLTFTYKTNNIISFFFSPVRQRGGRRTCPYDIYSTCSCAYSTLCDVAYVLDCPAHRPDRTWGVGLGDVQLLRCHHTYHVRTLSRYVRVGRYVRQYVTRWPTIEEYSSRFCIHSNISNFILCIYFSVWRAGYNFIRFTSILRSQRISKEL